MSRWLAFAFLALLLNGTVLTLQKLLPVRFTNQFLALLFTLAGVICWSIVIVLKRPFRFRHFALGAATGLVSYVGNVFLIRSLSLADAAVVFPIVFGSSMVVVTLVSTLAFREKLSPRGICAVAVGIASVVVLSVS